MLSSNQTERICGMQITFPHEKSATAEHRMKMKHHNKFKVMKILTATLVKNFPQNLKLN
jgi:hypothetical protein